MKFEIIDYFDNPDGDVVYIARTVSDAMEFSKKYEEAMCGKCLLGFEIVE